MISGGGDVTACANEMRPVPECVRLSASMRLCVFACLLMIIRVQCWHTHIHTHTHAVLAPFSLPLPTSTPSFLALKAEKERIGDGSGEGLEGEALRAPADSSFQLRRFPKQ